MSGVQSISPPPACCCSNCSSSRSLAVLLTPRVPFRASCTSIRTRCRAAACARSCKEESERGRGSGPPDLGAPDGSLSSADVVHGGRLDEEVLAEARRRGVVLHGNRAGDSKRTEAATWYLKWESLPLSGRMRLYRCSCSWLREQKAATTHALKGAMQECLLDAPLVRVGHSHAAVVDSELLHAVQRGLSRAARSHPTYPLALTMTNLLPGPALTSPGSRRVSSHTSSNCQQPTGADCGQTQE